MRDFPSVYATEKSVNYRSGFSSYVPSHHSRLAKQGLQAEIHKRGSSLRFDRSPWPGVRVYSAEFCFNSIVIRHGVVAGV